MKKQKAASKANIVPVISGLYLTMEIPQYHADIPHYHPKYIK